MMTFAEFFEMFALLIQLVTVALGAAAFALLIIAGAVAVCDFLVQASFKIRRGKK